MNIMGVTMIEAMFCIHTKCTEQRKTLTQKNGTRSATYNTFWFVKDIFKTFDLTIRNCPDCGFPMTRRKFTKTDQKKIDRINKLNGK